MSGGALLIPESAEDLEQLRLATEEARRLVSQSGRYALVDVSAADAGEVKARKFSDCDGCDAAVAASSAQTSRSSGLSDPRDPYRLCRPLSCATLGSGKLIGVEQTD